MALRNILIEGDERLRKKSRPVTSFDKKLHMLLEDMAETMYDAPGVGLAAPQVGVLRQAIIVDVGDGLIELINPVIVESSGSQTGPEACLSVPDMEAQVCRPNFVKIRAQDRNGKMFEITGEEFKARAFCHEIDHLLGILYIDVCEEGTLGPVGDQAEVQAE